MKRKLVSFAVTAMVVVALMASSASATMTWGSCSYNAGGSLVFVGANCPTNPSFSVAAYGNNRSPYESASVWERTWGYLPFDNRVGPGEVVRVTSFLDRYNGSTWVYTGRYEEVMWQAWGVLAPANFRDVPGYPWASSSGLNTYDNSIPVSTPGYYRLRVYHEWLNAGGSNPLGMSAANSHSLAVLATSPVAYTNWVAITTV